MMMFEVTRNETSKKDMLRLFRKSLTAISKMNPKNIEVSLDYRVGMPTHGDMFDITVFDHNAKNCSFYFYKFTSLKQNQENLDRAIAVIKTDKFDDIESVKIDH